MRAKYLAEVSQWIDDSNNHKDSEAILWGRISKVAEETGEVISALIGFTGQNPRKGVYATKDDVIEELLDVAFTALAAVEHMTGNQGFSVGALSAKIGMVHTRMLINEPDRRSE